MTYGAQKRKNKGSSTTEYIILFAAIISVLMVFANGPLTKSLNATFNSSTSGMVDMSRRLYQQSPILSAGADGAESSNPSPTASGPGGTPSMPVPGDAYSSDPAPGGTGGGGGPTPDGGPVPSDPGADPGPGDDGVLSAPGDGPMP